MSEGPRVKFTVGIEDKPVFHWQLPILLESLARANRPDGWEAWVVVCADGQPLSEPLARILDAYADVAVCFKGRNWPYRQTIDFVDGPFPYLALNRMEALAAVARWTEPGDIVFLTETDTFLHGALRPEIFPARNALRRNWLCSAEPFFALKKGDRGVNLPLLSQALGLDEGFEPAGVAVFLDSATLRHPKFVKDCFRFAQLLRLAAKIVDAGTAWVAEMPAFALALHANGIAYDVIETPEFRADLQNAEVVPAGTFYHYYNDGRAFFGDAWCKQSHSFDDFLLATTPGQLRALRDGSATVHGRDFFSLALAAQQRTSK